MRIYYEATNKSISEPTTPNAPFLYSFVFENDNGALFEFALGDNARWNNAEQNKDLYGQGELVCFEVYKDCGDYCYDLIEYNNLEDVKRWIGDNNLKLKNAIANYCMSGERCNGDVLVKKLVIYSESDIYEFSKDSLGRISVNNWT